LQSENKENCAGQGTTTPHINPEKRALQYLAMQNSSSTEEKKLIAETPPMHGPPLVSNIY
jgi:hypothetical protein